MNTRCKGLHRLWRIKKKKKIFSKIGCRGKDVSLTKEYSSNTLLGCVHHGTESLAGK